MAVRLWRCHERHTEGGGRFCRGQRTAHGALPQQQPAASASAVVVVQSVLLASPLL